MVGKFFVKASSDLRTQGDQARDIGNWEEAANIYLKYLDSKPKDFGIWVQAGNCMKEAKNFDKAQEAYEKAISIKPDDADVYLQLGHLMKMLGRRQEAIKYYKKSNEIDSSNGYARLELSSLGVKLATLSPLETPQFKDKRAKILDITDLLIFLSVHIRVTGIQRVQSAIIQEVMKAAGSENDFAAGDVLLCYCDQGERVFYGLPAAAVARLINVVSAADVTRQSIDLELRNVYSSKVPLDIRSGDIYTILGAFWIGNDYSSSLIRIKNKGAKVGVYIYDLIPLTHPQFVVHETRKDTLDKLIDVLHLADFVLTISDYVAKEVEHMLRGELKSSIPVMSVPLSHAMPEPEDSGLGDDVSEDFQQTVPDEFVLCVCTLEGRKNHMLLLNIWSSLYKKYDGKIPSLVLVGKWGWKIEEFQQQLAASNAVNGKIVILGNLSDIELKYLYERCMFTVFPSFVEGWGLPVGESLAHGKPCIASNSSSIPEVGGEFCRYINPHDLIGATEVVEQAIVNRADLRQWTNHIVQNFKIRSWADVAADFLKKLSSASSGSQENKLKIELKSGEVYSFTRSARFDNSDNSWAVRSIRHACSHGWGNIEDWGVWSLRRLAEIAFDTNLPAGTKVRVLLNLRLPPDVMSTTVLTRDSSGQETVMNLKQTAAWYNFLSVVDNRGRIHIYLDRMEGQARPVEGRTLYIGFSAIAYHASNDIEGRFNVLETIAFSPR